MIQNQDGLACLLFCLNMGDLPKTNNAIEKREAWKQRILGFSMGLKVWNFDDSMQCEAPQL